jgi:hypothetical protein
MIDSGDDPISLSFIDCMSCSLAAALFMFIIFGAIPHQQASMQAAMESSANDVPLGANETIEAPAGGDEATEIVPAKIGGDPRAPIDVEVAFNLPIAIVSASWRGSELKRSYFRISEERARVFVASLLRPNLANLEFVLTNRQGSDTEGLYSTIKVRAGNRIPITKNFLCPAAGGDQHIIVLRFSAEGRLISDCKEL